MTEDAQNIESVAPEEGDKIVDKNQAISDPQKRTANPDISGAKDLRKKGVQIVTRRGTE